MASRPLFLDPTAGGFRLGMVRSEADFARLGDEWPHTSGLIRSHPWLLAWWRNLGRTPRCELTVLTARDENGQLVALLPLYREHGRFVRRARWLGDDAGLVGDRAAAPAFADALAGALRSRFFDLIDLDGVDPGLRRALDERAGHDLRRRLFAAADRLLRLVKGASGPHAEGEGGSR